jgi:glycosyltransferase involved in cell wall biosynthesis
MKKILIASHSMEIGGAERSLLGLLNTIDYSQYKVDLLLYRHSGEFLGLIPEQVNLLPQNERYASLAVPMINAFIKGQLLMLAGRISGKFMAFRYDKKHKSQESAVGIEYSHKYTKRFLPPINLHTKYDLAISFLTPHYIVAEKVDAKKKAAWIHSDYSILSVNASSEKEMWQKYDYIVSVSEQSAESFCYKFPDLRAKVIILENILSPQFVRQQAEQFPVDQEMAAVNGTYKLLSVGRFGSAKNFDNVPSICKEILAAGYKVRWHIIGYGSGEPLVRSKIAEYGMQEHVIILGKKVNPYPYFKACDIYVQPSRYEGKAVTVREAQMLHKPVVITDFPTAKSQLKDGVDGIIVPLDNRGCAEGIIKLLEDPSLRNKLIENCKKTDYGNEAEIEKVYGLID